MSGVFKELCPQSSVWPISSVFRVALILLLHNHRPIWAQLWLFLSLRGTDIIFLMAISQIFTDLNPFWLFLIQNSAPWHHFSRDIVSLTDWLTHRNPDQPRSCQMNPDQPRSTQINPDQPRSTQINSDQLRSTQINPDQPRSTQINPDQHWSSQINPY